MSLILQIVLGMNSSTSRWVDVTEMAQAQDVEVVNNKGEPVTSTFLANMETYQKQTGKPGAGMVWRWQVGTFITDPRLYLKVQALPCNLDTVKANPALRHDNTKGIVVAQFLVRKFLCYFSCHN